MIDFNYIPKDIQENIINAYNQSDKGNFDEMKIIDYFLENELYELQSKRKDFCLSDFKRDTNLNTYFKRRKEDKKYQKRKEAVISLEDCF
jgi:hypothetical protein